MFENLTSRLSEIISKIKGNAIISEKHIDQTIGEIKDALLDADVALEAANKFIEKIRAEAIGKSVVKSISPDKMLVKIIHDIIVETLSDPNARPVSLDKKQKRIMVIGLQGSGKTTTAAKLAHLLTKNTAKKSLLASVDIYRPAAIDQLMILSKSVGASFTQANPEIDTPLAILERAQKQAQDESVDLFILDTAGRLHTDQKLMDELKSLQSKFRPDETLLVLDSMTGQDALNIAKEFSANTKVTGCILSRMDGDPRGGVALSMRIITSIPIIYVGTGEKIDQIELFNPQRIADRILGMGDIISLVEKAQEAQDEGDERLADRMRRGIFDMNDMAQHFQKINKMGGLTKLISFIPGLGNVSGMLKAHGLDDTFIKHDLAIISSMTKRERRDPEIIKNSRKLRISAGSGTSVQEINKLIKQYEQMHKMVRKMKNLPVDKIKNLFGNMPR